MIIYLIENTINNKKYVGQTACSIEKRWQEHVYNAHCKSVGRNFYPLYCAIRKYGESAFKISAIDVAQSQEELNQKEIYYIQKYKTMEKEYGYNRHPGGNKPPLSTPESRRKAGLRLKGRKFTQEHRQKISQSLTGKKYGARGPMAEDIKAKISKTNKQRCAELGGGFRSGLKSSPEHIEKIRIANTGKTHSEKTRLKISQSKTNPSVETRERLRLSHLGKKQSKETIEKRQLSCFLKTVAWG